MITLIQYRDGRLQGAVVLSTSKRGLRLAVPGYDDVVEFWRLGNDWGSEFGDPVQINFSAAEEANPQWVGPLRRVC